MLVAKEVERVVRSSSWCCGLGGKRVSERDGLREGGWGLGKGGWVYFAVEGAGVGDVFLGGVGVDWGVLVGWGLRELGGRWMCLRSVRLFGLFCLVVRILEIGEKERKGGTSQA